MILKMGGDISDINILFNQSMDSLVGTVFVAILFTHG
jgi:hypothetical protein